MTQDNDYDTCVYHALHESKVVKASEAEKLYKQGWHDTYKPEVLFSGVRGKWYLLIVSYRSFIKRVAPHWDSYKIITALLALVVIIVMLFIHFDSNPPISQNKQSEQTQN